MSDELHPGYYRDAAGNWQEDRREAFERRSLARLAVLGHERRKYFRRQADRELLQKDHKIEIEEALEDFAEDHDGRL